MSPIRILHLYVGVYVCIAYISLCVPLSVPVRSFVCACAFRTSFQLSTLLIITRNANENENDQRLSGSVRLSGGVATGVTGSLLTVWLTAGRLA